mmetsp:Transcript_39329/g.47655  ORF Transcript_39329/g.47655 Transcript_39329/m.47655 type:complete len:400 (+) Transcript_39329:189-1388(+)
MLLIRPPVLNTLAATCAKSSPLSRFPTYTIPNSSFTLVRHAREGRSRSITLKRRFSVSCTSQSDRAKVVFLGTPTVAASVLQQLFDVSETPNCPFEIAAVVSQPGRPKGRKRLITPSPVEELALERGYPSDKIYTPIRAKETEFLEAMATIAPDLCITAAYGNMLPSAFLNIPKHGTLNIHPSLLPKYRGAAPVQRCLEAGEEESGVSVAYTVLACDAGPVLVQHQEEVPPNTTTPEYLDHLFNIGTKLLLKNMAEVLDGSAQSKAWEQDESGVVHAPKVSKEEGKLDLLDPDTSAQSLHNKIRAFAGWPGTSTTLYIEEGEGKEDTPVALKLLKSRVCHEYSEENLQVPRGIQLVEDEMHIPCQDGGVLAILELQKPGKGPCSPTAFFNGLRGRNVRL